MQEDAKTLKRHKLIKNISIISLFSVIIVLCSWLTIPFTIPFTLQTFAIFSCLLLLGSKRGMVSIILYLLLGLIGLPVFSGFKSGFATMIGPTGGYMLGFIFMGIIYYAFEMTLINKNKEKIIFRLIALLIGLLVCYFLGTLWFSYVTDAFTVSGFVSELLIAVIPFIIPDLLKMGLSIFIYTRFKGLFEF